MYVWKWGARVVLLVGIFSSLVACSSGQPFFSSTPTIYDLTQRPAEFANKDVTVQGFYLWKPGDPAISLLIPALSTADGVRDAFDPRSRVFRPRLAVRRRVPPAGA